MASFRKLEMLRQKLRTDAGTNTFIHVRIADDINALPIDSRITKATIPQYIDIHQAFISHTTKSQKRKSYLLKLSDNLQEGKERAVFNGNGIAIVAIESGN